MENNTGRGYKRPVWQWVLIYVVIAAILYGLIYLLFIKKSNGNEYGSNASTTSGQTRDDTSNTNNTSNQANNPTAQSVSIKNFAYSPASMTVPVGTTVTWTNNDSVAHTVTSDSGKILDSGTIQPGQTFSFTFTKAGTYAYHCAIHPRMKATMTVQ